MLINSDDVVVFGAHFWLHPERRKLVKSLIYKLGADYFASPLKDLQDMTMKKMKNGKIRMVLG